VADTKYYVRPKAIVKSAQSIARRIYIYRPITNLLPYDKRRPNGTDAYE